MPVLKHGDLIHRFQVLDDEIDVLLSQQQAVIDQSRKLSLSSHIVLGRHARGKRSVLRWRQRYYQRRFLELDDPFCLHQVRDLLQNDTAGRLIEIEQSRVTLNYQLNIRLYERDRLRSLKEALARCRQLVRESS